MVNRTQRATLNSAQRLIVQRMSDELLEQIAGTAKPDLSGFTDQELESVAYGSPSAATMLKFDAAMLAAQ